MNIHEFLVNVGLSCRNWEFHFGNFGIEIETEAIQNNNVNIVKLTCDKSALQSYKFAKFCSSIPSNNSLPVKIYRIHLV